MRVSTKDSWPRAVFVSWLDQLMESLGVQSDTQLANRVGIANSSVISNWRRGQTQPDVGNLRKLAAAARVPAVQLYTMAGRIEPSDLETAAPTEPPMPREIQDLIAAYNRSDGPTRKLLLGQVEFLVRTIAPGARVH